MPGRMAIPGPRALARQTTAPEVPAAEAGPGTRLVSLKVAYPLFFAGFPTSDSPESGAGVTPAASDSDSDAMAGPAAAWESLRLRAARGAAGAQGGA